MGPMSSRLTFSGVVNNLQSALPRRSDRRVEPAPEVHSKLSADTPVLTPRGLGARRWFSTRFVKRNRKRNYCSCHSRENDDYACVFGKIRPDSTQFLPPVSSVRRCRPDYPTPLPPASEYRLFIENIDVERHVQGSTYEEQTTITAHLNSETRIVRCRHCKNAVSACTSSVSSPCATPLPQPTSRPVCRACVWHNLLPHDCECFGPPTTVLSWDVKNDRFGREPCIPVTPPFGRPRTKFSAISMTVEQAPEPERIEPIVMPDLYLKPESPTPETKPDQKPPKSETSPCVCAMPSSEPCPCDKRLFEAMNPWNKCKSVLFALLIIALTAWIIIFFAMS